MTLRRNNVNRVHQGTFIARRLLAMKPLGHCFHVRLPDKSGEVWLWHIYTVALGPVRYTRVCLAGDKPGEEAIVAHYRGELDARTAALWAMEEFVD